MTMAPGKEYGSEYAYYVGNTLFRKIEAATYTDVASFR